MPQLVPLLTRIFDVVPLIFASTTGFDRVTRDEAWPWEHVRLGTPEDLDAWAGLPVPLLHTRLRVILRGVGGYLYALWRVDDRPWVECPIVFLDRENYGNAVVAHDLAELLTLAAATFGAVNPRAHVPRRKELEPFFLVRGIQPSPDPRAAMQAALAAHPDFDAWLQAALDDRDEPLRPWSAHTPPVRAGLDPVGLLGRARNDLAPGLAGPGIELGFRDRRLETIWLTPSDHTRALRPCGWELFGRTRAEVRALAGPPVRSRETGPTVFDRFDAPDVVLQVEYVGGVVGTVTLIWPPSALRGPR